MNRKSILLSALISFCLGTTIFAQAPGGVTAGLKAWYNAEQGVTVNASNTVTLWANQTANANLTNLVPAGGATTLITNNPAPFNFHSFMQHNAGAMILANSVAFTDVVSATSGSMMGVGTASDQLICLTGNSTSGSFDNNRANTGTRSAKTEFGNKTTNNGFANYATGTVLNTGNANIFGMRAEVGATIPHQNTYNGLKATGTAFTRPSGSYRFAIGSYIGFFYGTNKEAEVICHNRQLTPDEFSRVETYLAIKYGVTLGTPTTPVDYLSSASAIVWPGDAAYQNNVTGICRDDASGLIQKQSKAVTVNSILSMYNDNTGGLFPAMNVDNTTTFAADLSFVLFGDNNATTTLNTCAMNGKVVRMNRIWKMVKTGGAGDVTIAFTATALPAGVTNILVSNDNTFPEASTTAYPLLTSGTLKYAVIPSGNTFFTFSADPLDITVDVAKITCQATNGGTLTGNVSGGTAPLSYSWNTTPAQTTATATNVQAGNYTLTVTQAAGCSYAQSATMTNEIIILTANLNATDVKCFGEDNGKITVTNTNGTPAYSYSLNNQSSWTPDNQFENLSNGLYTVYLKDVNGCTGKDTVSINEPDALSLQLKNVKNYFCELGATPNGSVEILLTGGTIPYNVLLNGNNVGPSLELKGLSENHYKYDVTDNNGCKINDTFSIEHIDCCFFFLPNAFSPNMDGKNETFEMSTTGNVRLNKMIIYNRYGQLIWGTFNQSEGWDGTQKGKPVDPGVYFYHLVYTCDGVNGPKTTEVSGDLTLIR